MAEIHFQTLPVYRIDQDTYEEWRRNKVEEFIGNTEGLSQEVVEHRKRFAENHFYEHFGPWIFNEVVGFLQLYFLGSQVRGQYFGSIKKRAVLTRRKVFKWRTWKLAAERELWAPRTDDSILKEVGLYVEDCRAELPGRHIDDAWLVQVGPYIKWTELLRATQV